MSSPVLGRTVRLDETRLVFLGQRDGDAGTFYVGLRNADGIDTKFKLSREAIEALAWLTIHPHDTLKETFPAQPRPRWEAVSHEDGKRIFKHNNHATSGSRMAPSK